MRMRQRKWRKNWHELHNVQLALLQATLIQGEWDGQDI